MAATGAARRTGHGAARRTGHGAARGPQDVTSGEGTHLIIRHLSTVLRVFARPRPVRVRRAVTSPTVECVITCVVHYVIDPSKTEAFERFGRRWMELVAREGGVHHGYFLPAEGASDAAMALFSFPSLAAYERYRSLFGKDPAFIEADRIRDESGCVLRYERTFMRPLLPDGD